MPTTSTTDRLARATEDLADILQTEHPATPFLQQGTVVNDAIQQLTKIFAPPNREETALAAPSPRQFCAPLTSRKAYCIMLNTFSPW